MGTAKKTDKILKKLEENSKSLKINRVPNDTKRKFIELANDQFCSDYGMTLKFLVDGLVDEHMRMVMVRIQSLEEQVESLKQVLMQEDESEGIRLMSGKEIKKKN